MLPSRLSLDRRSLLIGAGVTGSLVIGMLALPRRFRAPLEAGEGEHVIEGFLRLARDGTISVAVPATEMGQGIDTLVAQIVAVELGADWRKVGVEPAPVSPFYADRVIAAEWAEMWLPGPVADLPLLGDGLAQALAGEPGDALVRLEADREPVMLTAAGTTLAAFEPRLRAAAAALRHVLCAAAAAEAGLDLAACDTRAHAVVCGKKSWPFAALIDRALALSLPETPALRPVPACEDATASTGRTAAPAFPRLDLPAKVDGSLVFAGDVRLPDMVHAAIAHGPQGHCRLASHDEAAARGIPGLIGIVATDRWLAAVARTWHAADKAVKAMDPRFRVDRDENGRVVESLANEAALETAMTRGHATRIAAEGNPDALLAHPSIGARYDIEPALHAPLETASATARLQHGTLDLWIATQAPEAAARAAARGAGLSRSAVTVYPMPAGGSFDARLDVRMAEEVAVIARTVGRPVQLTWSRWQETLAGYPRTPVSAMLAAAFDPARQRLLGWRARLALPASAVEQGARLFDDADSKRAQDHAEGHADPLSCAGAMPVYAIPERAVDHLPTRISLPTGRLRGGAHGYTAFFTESFLDECAHALGMEPMSFRIGMLGDAPRLVACLQGAARLAMWGGGGNGSGQGIACHTMALAAPEGRREGHIAVVATARADAGTIRVESLSAFCDIGRVINHDIARQQIEGGLMFGLAHALGGSTTWSAGRPLAGRLAGLGLPLLADCPKVDVAFAQSEAEPFDPGDLGMVAAAPAIANALFSATGVRFRHLPLTSPGPVPLSER
ncbi:twin-arginine translocation pathway signal [Novosphingobium nitrogenifigens DSM 19370]|uniref:Twin-arginine translocation pathway signal n=1 Tax=Novosphingobium nitrogenifigens DSM 19370 TaxID=983920 RepID=F1Z502_9SPHN|nr:molybdopterin cofactor-binding domain-containing protein [Novosphingobium nitrogenifigens]EGD60041.1 twin-arginine translocation pathway signal [Novosphingobium nitrogenifigens DSM 19370]